MRVAPPFWRPTPATVAGAQVTALARGLGVDGFDALLDLSVRDPARYWREMMRLLAITWRRPYDDYVDLTDGAPFPKWFTGGVLNWTDTVFAHAAAAPERLALVAETEDGQVERVSYAALHDRVARLAAGLRAAGIARGDRVGLLMEVGVEAVATFLALSFMGAVAVPLFSGFGPEAIVARLASCGARALVATNGFRRRGRWVDIAAAVAEARRSLPALDLLVMTPGLDSAIPDGAVAWASLLDAAPLPDAEPMGADEPMMVIYTSGTTGKPKGPVHTHGGFPLKLAHDAAAHFDVGAGDVFFWPADMGWIAGPITVAAALMRGATMVCYAGAPDTPDWSRLSRLAEAHGVTHLGASPTLIRGLAGQPALAAAGSCASVRLLITGGEVISPEHMVWFQQTLGRGVCPVINYTGGTEVSGGLLGNVVVRPIVAGGFNAISPGIALDVLDDAGQPVRDQVGELSILQPFVGMTRGFWDDRERYLDTYWRQVPGVWTHGDLAVRTSEGQLFLVGRSDDTLKVAGKRLGPAEVEDVLLALPCVAEAAAIGVDDPLKGQRLVVFIVPAGVADAALIERDATAAVATRLGKPFQPSRVHVVPQLPKTRSQKVMRRVIRKIYCGQHPGDLTSMDDLGAIAVIEGVRPVG